MNGPTLSQKFLQARKTPATSKETESVALILLCVTNDCAVTALKDL